MGDGLGWTGQRADFLGQRTQLDVLWQCKWVKKTGVKRGARRQVGLRSCSCNL